MINQKMLDYFFNALGLLAILVIGFYICRGIVPVISFADIILSASGIAINKIPKEQTGITETKPINLKLWGEYQIDVPQNYIKYQKQILHPEQNSESLHLWAMYPTFEGFTSSNAGIFNAGYQDNNVVQFTIHRFPPFSSEKVIEQRKSYGQEGIKGLLEVNKNFEQVPKAQQPFSNPIEYSQGIKTKVYLYIYDAGDHAIYINCHGSVHQRFPGLTCDAKKIWANSVAISYEFGISNLGKFGEIEKSIDKLLSNFNLRKIKHD